MDLSQIINEQRSKLVSNHYIKLLWGKIKNANHEQPNPNVLRQLENDYRNHLPVDYEGFLDHLLEVTNEHVQNEILPDWGAVDQKYLVTLLFWTIQERNEQDILIPLNAARIYLLINSLPETNHQKTSHDVVYYECLSLFNYLNSLNCKNDAYSLLLQNFNRFLQKRSIPENLLVDTIDTLFSVATKNNNALFVDFTNDAVFLNTNRLAFVCLKTIFTKDGFDGKFTVSFLMLKHNTLCAHSSRNTFTIGNIEALLCDIKNLVENEILCSLKSINTLDEYNDYDRVVHILNNLEYNDYTDFCDYLLKVLRQTEIITPKNSDLGHNKKCFRKMGLSVMKNPHPKVEPQKRLTYLGFLIDIYFSLLVDDDIEDVCYFIDQILSISDATVKSAIEVFLNRDINHDVNLLSILEVLRVSVDFLWRKKNYNVLYIKIICKMSFVKPQILFTGSVLNLIEKLCLEASPLDLKECAENLTAVMVNNCNQPLVVEKVLNVLVHFALIPIPASTAYCRLLNTTVLQNIATKNFGIGIKIADILISCSYDYENVFKKLHTNNFVKPHIFPALIKELSTHKEAWKLLNALCDVVSFNSTKDFLTVLSHVDSTLIENNYDNANVMFSVLYKMLKQKPVLSNSHIHALNTLHGKIVNKIAEREIPVQCVTNIFGFLKLSNEYVINTTWSTTLFNDFHQIILNDIINIINNKTIVSHIFQRNALYFANILLISDINASNEIIKRLEQMLLKFDELFPDLSSPDLTIWTSCLTIYTAICIKEKRVINNNTNAIFSLAFKNTDVNLNIHAVHYFYDLCNVHLDNFDNLVKKIFQLLGACDSYFTVHCVKIIERLISNDYIRLSEGQLLKFLSLLAHENYHVKDTIKYTLRKNLLAKTQHTISDYFVSGIAHYNKFKSHPKYLLTEEEALHITLTKEKRHTIYKYLFNLLPLRNQFKILTEISTEIFESMLKKTIKIPWTVFKDCLFTFFLFVTQHHQYDIENRKDFYEKCIKDLLSLSFIKTAPKDVTFSEFHNQIEILLKKLLLMPYCILKLNDDFYEDVIEVVLLVSQCFLSDIKAITYHNNHTWVKLFRGFCNLYKQNRQKLTFMPAFEEVPLYESFQVNASAASTPSHRHLLISPSYSLFEN